MSMQTKEIFEFGSFRLDPTERLLLRQGEPVPLPPKAFDALVFMVKSRGRLLEKDELLRKVWPGTFVEESNLAQHISILRKTLRDGEDGMHYIETIPRHGYRFIAEVRQVPSTAAETKVVSDSAASQSAVLKVAEDVRVQRRSPGTVFVFAVIGALLAILVAVPIWKRFRRSKAERIQSLAVLPLRNLSGDPAQEYFAEGMTEALITDLAKISGLKVISHTSSMQYQNSHKSLPKIAQELGVDAVIEGAVLRSGERVRITAQLVRGSTDQHIWAESYERDLRDLLALQDEVSRSIASQIEKEIALRAPPASVVSPQGREDYLKGRYFWNQRSEAGYLKAIDYFQAAVTEDPQYAQAYAGLADAFALLGSMPAKMPRHMVMPRAKEAALTALKLDDTLADAHTSLAFVEMHYEWNFPEAEREFKRAIELNPNYSTAHEWYAFDLIAMDRLEEAIAEIKQARQTDPLSAIINTDLAEILYFARHYEEAIKQARATADMDPNFAHVHRVLERIYDETGAFPDAIAEGERAVTLTGGQEVWMLLDLARTYALAGNEVEMNRCLDKAASLSPGRTLPQTDATAEIYVALNNPNRALEVLDAVYAQRDGSLILLNADPGLDRLRSDPRFKRLKQRVGLPSGRE